MSTPSPIAVTQLLAAAAYYGDYRLHSVFGGGNNRVYRVDVRKGPLLLKVYFQHPLDPRDRLGAEWSFSRFAWRSGIRWLPQPLACDRQRGMALYKFVHGRRLRPHQVTAAEVEQALAFFVELNRPERRAEAQALPAASEACFTLVDHLDATGRRLRRLEQMPITSAFDVEAAHFVRSELAPSWDRIRAATIEGAGDCAWPPHTPLRRGDWRLSPSDFGFHNALRTKEGTLRFLDFEYAGWDDPAKMVCDFFSHVGCSVSASHWPRFAQAVVGGLSRPDWHLQRLALLLPVHGLKWCCIMLNEFLPVSSQRRRFAVGGRNGEERKVAQLRKARSYLRRLQEREVQAA